MIFRQIFISEVLVAIIYGIYLNGVVCQPSGYSYKDPKPEQEALQPLSPKVKDLLEKALPLAQAAENSNQVHSNVVAINPAPKDKNIGGSGSGRFWKASQRNYLPPNSGKSQKVLNDDPKKRKSIRRLNDGPKRLRGPPSSSSRRQHDDAGDDDDTDGGEYEGADQGQGQQGCSGPKKSMPMMIIRGFDVLSMDVPVMGQKPCKPPPQPTEEPETEPPEAPSEDVVEPSTEEATTCTTIPSPEPVTDANCKLEDDLKVGDVGFANDPVQSENKPVQLENKKALFENNQPAFENKPAIDKWGDWSICSKTCGVGLQSRSRLMPTGFPEHDTEVRTCQLSECPEGKPHDASQVGLPQYGYGEVSKT